MIFDLIDQIYDTVLNPDLWPAVLGDINTAFGAVSTTLVPLNKPAGVRISPGGEAAQDAYVQHWWSRDSIARAILKTGRLGTFCDWRLLPTEQTAHDPFYQEFRHDYDMKHNIALTTDAGDGEYFGVSLQLPLSAPAPPADEVVTAFGIIGRHVTRAVMLARQAGLADTRNATLSTLMSTLSCGVALLDQTGRVTMANAAFEALAPDGLRIVGGMIRATGVGDQSRLDTLVRRLVAGQSAAGLPAVSLARPSGRRPLLLSGLPVTDRRRDVQFIEPPGQVRAILLAFDPEAAVPKRIEPTLRDLSLSAGEARLACLIGQGRSPRDAAIALGLTEGTVRTRLKVIYDKLTVSRQSELARIVTQLAMVGGFDGARD